MCNPGGVNIHDIEGAPEWWIKNRILTKEQPYPDWKSHHGYMLEKLSFIKHIGIKSSYVGTYSPYRPTGPNVNTMQDHQDTIRICDDIVEGFVACELDNNSITPACELEQFMSYFESDDQHAFGRGLTIAEEDINTDSVQENIEFIEKTVENLNHRGQLIVAMKGRCERVGRPDLAEIYYLAQRRLIALGNEKKSYSVPAICSGNYRPIGY
jgi:hypothetical protein